MYTCANHHPILQDVGGTILSFPVLTRRLTVALLRLTSHGGFYLADVATSPSPRRTCVSVFHLFHSLIATFLHRFCQTFFANPDRKFIKLNNVLLQLTYDSSYLVPLKNFIRIHRVSEQEQYIYYMPSAATQGCSFFYSSKLILIAMVVKQNGNNLFIHNLDAE